MTNTMDKLPSFLIIGAMKSATSSLYDQLVRQPGIFMSTPKEPNFFSDDAVYAKGMAWYGSLFAAAQEGDLIGEASTHYTKLPTYPDTVSRIAEHLGSPRLIYVMRHPVDRLISHYIHEWSQGVIRCDIDKALDRYPELIDYSRYTMQLQPFIDAFGRKAILPVFFDHIKRDPESELIRICEFIGYQGNPAWYTDLSPSNVSLQRVRRFPLYSLLVDSKPATWLRRNFIPKSWRDHIRHELTLKKRPELNARSLDRLNTVFDQDLAILGQWLGAELNCGNFIQATAHQSLEWQREVTA